MSKLSRKELFHLKGIAKELPIVLTNTHEKVYVKGKDILEWNTITEIEGKPIDPKKLYLWHYPVQMYHNHFRRLRKAYMKEGMNGVIGYLKKINDIIAGQKTGQAMSVFFELQKYINGAAA